MTAMMGSAASRADDDDQARQAARDVLQRELTTQQGFVQVHAAEALLDAGLDEPVRRQFALLGQETRLPLAIGIWRVLARVEKTAEQRQSYRERIRRVALDHRSEYRVHAIESLAKLGDYRAADRAAWEQFITANNDSTAAFARWLLAHSGQADDPPALARLLASPDPVARLRAGYALSRSGQVAAEAASAVCAALDQEPPDSPARVYLLSAALRHGAPERRAEWLSAAERYLQSSQPNEALEAGFALSILGQRTQVPRLREQLSAKEADARIGAAAGILRILGGPAGAK